MAGANHAVPDDYATTPMEHDADILQDEPVPKSSRSTRKCTECRRRKTKCAPMDRSWPIDGKCIACEKSGLDCGPMTKAFNTDPRPVEIATSGTLTFQSNPVQYFTENRDRGAPSEEKRSGILNHLGAQERISVTQTEEMLLSTVETNLKQLSMSSNWSVMMPRLVSYLASLSTPITTTTPLPLISASPVRALSQTGQRDEAKRVDHSLSRVSSRSSVGSAASSFGTKQYFCFHDSCAQEYHAGRSLETHVRNHHRARWPVLPGTCDHAGRIIQHMTWDDSLAHLIFHQKTHQMTRSDYNEMFAKARSRINYDNVRTDNTHYTSDIGFGVNSMDGYLGVDHDDQWPHGQDTFSGMEANMSGI